MPTYVYPFDQKHRKPPMQMKDLLGGKGANLAEMTSVLGLPVPAGFTISTDACRAYMAGGWPDGLDDEIAKNLAKLEKTMGRRFGDPVDPLLVSVRSGAKFSMPGMMDTVLNLGLNDDSVEGLAKQTDDERFAYDSYRRFIQMYGRIVLDMPGEDFDRLLETAREWDGVATDAEISAETLRRLVQRYKDVVRKHTGKPFPQDPTEQLRGAIEAVFTSWDGARALAYRIRERISHDLGTAVNVQAMVFGNRDDELGHRRRLHPRTRHRREQAVRRLPRQRAGRGRRGRHPQHRGPRRAQAALARRSTPSCSTIFDRLERHYRDMCDTEFTIEQGKLWMLQTRVGKRTGAAALRMAVEMTTDKGVEDQPSRGRPARHRRPPRPGAAPAVRRGDLKVIAKGLAASPGAAVGQAYFTADDAADAADRGEKVILVRSETSPEDVHGMQVSEGILTARGGLVSHAAVVARGWGIPAVVGAEPVKISGKQFTVGDVDGQRGRRHLARRLDRRGGPRRGRRSRPPEPPAEFTTILEVGRQDPQGQARRAGQRRRRPRREANARQFGAEGIGLCRTEHMFLGEDRLPIVRRMILADTPEEEEAALEELRGVQKADFEEILEAMDGLPVTVRLLDPPLHEFLPVHRGAGDQGGHHGSLRRGAGPARRGQGVARVQPDARHARRAPRRRQARPLRHAGASPHGGRRRAGQGGRSRSSRS